MAAPQKCQTTPSPAPAAPNDLTATPAAQFLLSAGQMINLTAQSAHSPPLEISDSLSAWIQQVPFSCQIPASPASSAPNPMPAASTPLWLLVNSSRRPSRLAAKLVPSTHPPYKVWGLQPIPLFFQHKAQLYREEPHHLF